MVWIAVISFLAASNLFMAVFTDRDKLGWFSAFFTCLLALGFQVELLTKVCT